MASQRPRPALAWGARSRAAAMSESQSAKETVEEQIWRLEWEGEAAALATLCREGLAEICRLRAERAEARFVAWRFRTFLGQGDEVDQAYAADMAREHRWLGEKPEADR